jgi:hypothetical protein
MQDVAPSPDASLLHIDVGLSVVVLLRCLLGVWHFELVTIQGADSGDCGKDVVHLACGGEQAVFLTT